MLLRNWLRNPPGHSRRSLCVQLERTVRRAAEVLEQRCLLAGTASIAGISYFDADASGTRDDGEHGLSGWTVYLDQNRNGQLDTTSLDIAAEDTPVEIEDLHRASSFIEVANVNGVIVDLDVTINVVHTYIGDLSFSLMSPDGTTVDLIEHVGDGAEGFTDTRLDDEASLSISNRQATAPYFGSFRPREPLSAFDGQSPLGTWTLLISDDSSGDSGELLGFELSFQLSTEPARVTSDDGSFRFDELAAGTYVVGEVPRNGFRPTSPANSQQTVRVRAGEERTEIDFGNDALPLTLSGQVWDDLNGDGQHQADEAGLDGVIIELLDGDTLESLGYTTSGIELIDYVDSDGHTYPVTEPGHYSFSNLEPGHYIVRQATQPGNVGTFPEANRNVAGPNPIVQAGSFSVTVPPTGSSDSPADWLPDLVIDMQSESGLRDVFIDGSVLRFGQATPNVGHGPLRIVGGSDNGDGTQQVLQRIYNDQVDSTTGEHLFTERPAGNFSFHPEHNHIHFNEFAQYTLRAALPDTNDDGILEVGDMLRGGTKTSFCLVNVAQFDMSLPNADPDGSGLGCDVEQEISVGWEDIYGSGTEGQQIDVSGLEPGYYWLEATVDPDNHFAELDETNNFGRILVHIAPADRLHDVFLVPGEDATGFDFGNFRTAEITGFIYQDSNSDGLPYHEEHAPAGVAVFIDLNGDHVLNNPTSGDGVADGLALEPWALTNDFGYYLFRDLGPGSYQVRLVAPEGSVQTSETPAPFMVHSGETVLDVDFGYGTIAQATTIVSHTHDSEISISDGAARGQADNLFVDVEVLGKIAFLLGELDDPAIAMIRIHDPDHVLTTDVGIQEGLHTVFIPLTESLDLDHINVSTGLGNDQVRLNLGFSFLTASIDGGAGNDFLEIRSEPFIRFDEGLHGNSLPVDFFEGFNVLAGGNGNDTLLGSNADDLILGQEGNDSIVGNGGNDTLGGQAGRDTLFGGDGDDALDGGDGDDVLWGEAGNDLLSGSQGIDRTSGGEGSDSTVWESGEGADTVLDTEGFVVGATEAADVFQVSVNRSGTLLLTQRNPRPVTLNLNQTNSIVINGRGGDDLLIASSDVLTRASVLFNGDAGTDLLQITGTSFADTIVVRDFAFDTSELHAFGLYPDTERVLAQLGSGNDRFDASSISDASVSITVFGESGHDTILGGAGDDILNGGEGNDRLNGGRGNDQLRGLAGSDTILGGDGEDQIIGDAGNDVLLGEAGNDHITGDAGADTLVGGAGNNTLIGGAGNDLLIGGDDNDTLNGQGGQDRLFGGGGINRIVRPAPGEIVTVFADFRLSDFLDDL